MQEKFDLDDLDRRILQQLQIDASLNYPALAARVHASAPTCLRRVKRLRELGVIAKQVAILAEDKLSSSLTALIEVSLDRQDAQSLQAFEKLIASVEEVQQCYRVSPGPDFVLVARLANMPAYHAFAHRLFAQQHNIRNVRTFFSTLRSKFTTQIAL